MPAVLETKFQEIVGRTEPEGGRWAQVLTERPDDPALKKLRGELFAVLDLTAAVEVDLKFLVRLIGNTLKETYYANLDGTPLSALEKSLLEARHRVEGFAAENAAALSGTEIDFNLTAAVLWDKVLYVSQLGEGVAYLLREGRVQRVGKGHGSQVATTSGILAAEDLVILGSSYFGEAVSPAEIAADVSSLAAKLKTVETPAAWAALLVNVKSAGSVARGDFVRFSLPTMETDQRKTARLRLPRLSRRRLVVPVEGSQFRSRRWLWPLLLLGLGAVLIASVLLTRRQREETTEEEVTTAVLGAGTEAITEAESLLGLNDQRAKEILEEAAASVREALVNFPEDNGLQNQLAEIEKLLTVASHRETVEAEIFYQLPEGSRPVSLEVVGNRLIVADRGRRCWLEIAAGSAAECRFDDDRLDLKAAFSVDDTAYALADDGFYEASDSAALVKTAVEDFDDFGAVTATRMYLTNLYLLLSGQNKIIKITPTAGDRVALNWLEEETDLSGERALAVDGHIYTVGDRGIRRFYLGAEEEFVLKGGEETLTEAVDITTNANLDYLYILDAGAQRVVVFDKEGNFIAQYHYRADLEVRRLAVNTEATVVYLLTDSAVWRFAL